MSPQHSKLAEVVAENQSKIKDNLYAAVQPSLYSNKMHVAPRRLKQLMEEEVDALHTFLLQPDTAKVVERGQQLAESGFGHQTMINLTVTLRAVGWQWLSQQNPTPSEVMAIETYTSALMEGYMTGFEALLQREQQLTHEAYRRAQER